MSDSTQGQVPKYISVMGKFELAVFIVTVALPGIDYIQLLAISQSSGPNHNLTWMERLLDILRDLVSCGNSV